MLVCAFQIEVGWIAEVVSLAGDGGPARAGIEPNIHGVGALAPLVRFVGVAGRQQLGFVLLPPHVGTVLADQGLDVREGVGVEQHLTVAAVIENGDRHTPGALARDAPVAPFLHHRLDPIASGCRRPLHVIDGVQSLLAEAIHRGEPLLRGPEDGWFLGAPVVGIAVAVGLLLQQRSSGLQGVDDRRVGVLENVQSCEGARLVGEGAGFIHRTEHGETILLTGVEVIDPMPRGGMDESRSGFGGDVVTADHDRTGAIQQGVAIHQSRQQGSLHGQLAAEGKSQGDRERFDQIRRHQQQPACAVVGEGVLEPFVHRHGQIGRQGPGGGCPDRDLKAVAEAGVVIGQVDSPGVQSLPQGGWQCHRGESDKDTGAGVSVGILQLGFGQSRA